VETMSALRLFWNSVPELLQHEHCWVRVVVCRLVGRHFAALGKDVLRGSEVGEEERRNEGYSLFSCKQGGVRRLMKALCLVLEGAVLPEALAEQVIKNLLFIGRVMVLHPSVGDVLEVGTAESDEDELAEQQLPEAALDRNRGLFWLLMRMSGIASRLGKGDNSPMRRASAMRFLAAAVASWDVESVRPYMRLFVGAVLRVLENSDRDGEKSVETASPEVALNAMAMAVQDTLIKTLGADSYYAVYNEQLSKLRNDRMERKRKHAVESAIDPERAAKKRLKRSTAKAEARRRNSASNFGARGTRRVLKSSFAVHGAASRGFLPDD
jgi:U3 small nucleolar RNA-associated protein 20